MDILIPFVDSSDEQWQDIFLNSKNIHPRTARVRDVFLLPYRKRFASHGLFKYWWRALERNYKSLTRVHLLLMQPSQFPAFLNPEDPRIVVHYHDEFIPEKHRPCFNSSTIELCAIRELDLKGNFILANDDMYVNAPVDDAAFEKDGKPLTYLETYGETYGTNNQFRQTLMNGHRLVSTHLGRTIPYFKWYHLFQVYNAEFCKEFLNKKWATISRGLGKWRGPDDYNHLLLMMAQNVIGVSVNSEKFPRLGYFEMPLFTRAMYDIANTRRVVCFNDTDGRHIETTSAYLELRYPDKCSFEI